MPIQENIYSLHEKYNNGLIKTTMNRTIKIPLLDFIKFTFNHINPLNSIVIFFTLIGMAGNTPPSLVISDLHRAFKSFIPDGEKIGSDHGLIPAIAFPNRCSNVRATWQAFGASFFSTLLDQAQKKEVVPGYLCDSMQQRNCFNGA